jgi:hypothetical protein
MAFAVSTRSALDGAGATIPGGIDFVDVSGTGAGPWIIAKTTIDPAGVNVQFVLANNAAKCDVSSINGVTTATGHGTAAGALRVELPTDGTGLVNAAQSGTWNVGTVTALTAITNALPAGANVIGAVTQSGTWAVTQSGNWTSRIVGNAGGVVDFAGQNAAQPANAILIGGEFNTAPTTLTTGNASPLQLDSAGNLLVNLKANSFGTVTVTGTVAISGTTPVSGTITANQGGAPWSENITQFGGVALSTGVGASGTGIPRVTVANDSNILSTQSGTWTVQQGTPPWTVNPGTAANWAVGATGAAVPANADYKGSLAKTALPAAATDGNLTGVMSDKFGRQVALVGTIRDLVGTQTTTLSASVSETTIVTAGAAGVFNDLIMLIVTNTSASTTTRIDFRDTTAGTVLFSLISIGGQQPVGFALPIPIPQTTAATNWTAQCATSTTDIRIYAVYAKNK